MSHIPVRAEDWYKGFFLEGPVGNNAFSFDTRRYKKIFVPALKTGSVTDLTEGVEIVFAEIEDGVEKCRTGLKEFVHTRFWDAETFIFDNHNHAFFFWALALRNGWMDPGNLLVHIDQHTDMRKPQKWMDCRNLSDLDKVFCYVNYDLNVGNFIQPALKCAIFSEVDVIDNRKVFENDYERPFVLDIDVDIFSPDMDYIPMKKKLCTIRHLMRKAKFITIATSPFFMEQKQALSIVRQLFEED